MKNTLLFMTFFLSTVSAKAGTTTKPILVYRMSSGFAPPEYQGRYLTQVEADGTVRYIDNKDRQTVVAKLSSKAVTELKKQIEAVKPGSLVKPDQPQCQDAGSVAITAIKASGEETILSEEEGCVTATLPDAGPALKVAETLQDLTRLLVPRH